MRCRRIVAAVSAAILCAAAGWLGWHHFRAAPPPAAAAPAVVPPASAGRATEGLPLVLSVLASGGALTEIEAAVCYLDTLAREGPALPESDRTALVAALARPAPDALTTGARAHIFNSACNALGRDLPVPDGSLLTLLEREARGGGPRVTRLYALQHLGVRYHAVPPAWRERIRSLARALVADPTADTAGTALVLLRSWDDPALAADGSSSGMSRAIAADQARPVDVRVSALHAAGDDPEVLGLARAIAPDPDQPAILRKSALCLIGRHGTADDLPLLGRCAAASPRLAQAADPATLALKARLEGRPEPKLQPY